MTSSTSPASRPARRTAWRMAWAPRSAPCVRLSAPRRALPIGVRAVDTMTASSIFESPVENVPVMPGARHAARQTRHRG
ncbi:Uncharacterised protein [Bordetella pertussis]|nr:Uncharacterised protein [Bordetella pertussis]